jgi:hypothetical protein
MNTANFGSVSSGTMRKEDLIPSFCWELRNLKHRSKELSRIEKYTSTRYFESEQSDYDLESLFDMLNEHAPQHAYFGAHPGDGSDYGFWIDESLEYDFDGLKIEDINDIPSGYIGEVLYCNDHGNLTLYFKSARKLTEVWSIV